MDKKNLTLPKLNSNPQKPPICAKFQVIRSIALEAELQTPPCPRNQTLLPPIVEIVHEGGAKAQNMLECVAEYVNSYHLKNLDRWRSLNTTPSAL